MRYFLNVLEADRNRFSDLKQVYALTGASPGAVESAIDLWSPLAVPVLTYPVRDGAAGSPDHGALWEDLGRLADLVENVARERARLVRTALGRPRADIGPEEVSTLSWALADPGAAMDDVVVNAVADPGWWPSLLSDRLLTTDRAGRAAAIWASERWEDRAAFQTLLGLAPQLGEAFTYELSWRLTHTRFGCPPWELAWRLLARQAADRGEAGQNRVHGVVSRLERGLARDADLRRLIRHNAPEVRLSPHLPFWDEREEETEPGQPARLKDLCRVDLQTADEAHAPDLMHLLQDTRSGRIAELATGAILDALTDGEEAGVIGPGWDVSDLQVPAIGAHEQNRLVQGVLPLTNLLAELAVRLAASDPAGARGLFERWRGAGFRLTTRLWLFGLLTGVYSADEAAAGLLDLSGDLFWTIKRDALRVMAEKLEGCDPGLRVRLEERILREAPDLYADLEIPSGETDWRPDARDQATWLRLSKLAHSGPLGAEARDRLAEVRGRRSYLAGEPQEEDLFSTWSTFRVGFDVNIQPLLEANVEDRVEVATSLIRSGGFEQRHGWSSFVETSPQGALDSLLVTEVEPERATLWGEFLSRISYVHKTDPPRADLAREWLRRSLEHLEGAGDAFLQEAVYALTSALEAAVELGAEVGAGWWDRLWTAAERTGAAAETPGDLSLDILNSSGGRLALTLLRQLQARSSPEQAGVGQARLQRVIASTTAAGAVGRGTLAQYISLVRRAAPDLVAGPLLARLMADDREGRALRAMLLQWGRLDAATSAAVWEAIRIGARESRASSVMGVNVAAKLIYPLVLRRRRLDAPDWGASEAEVAAVLGAAHEEVRVAVLDYLVEHMRSHLEGRDPALEWCEVIQPVLDRIWPQDRHLRSPRYTPHLLTLIALAGDAFPQAADWAQPWLETSQTAWINLHELYERREEVGRFPEELFAVLWTVAGPPFTGRSHELAGLLDVAVRNRPALARDRRMQWLEPRTYRPTGV